jgi:hypothetical protein
MVAKDDKYFMIHPYFNDEIQKAMKLLNGEPTNLLALRTQCLKKWDSLKFLIDELEAKG